MTAFFKSLISLAIMCLFLSSGVAQTNPSARLSIGLDGAYPTNTAGDIYGTSIGLSAQADIPFKSNFFYTFNAGYNVLKGIKSYEIVLVDGADEVKYNLKSASLKILPLKAGLKFFPANHIYVQAEGGAVFFLNKETDNDRSVAFIYAPQLGVRISISDHNSIDAGLRYEKSSQYNVYTNRKLSFVGLRLAYAFNAK
jgi:hypothetical protein